MKQFMFWIVVIGAAAGIGLFGPAGEIVRGQTPPPAKQAAAKGKEASAKLLGRWELAECDYGGQTIGYHPALKVSPGYAMLMFAFTATHPDKGAEKRQMQWSFDEKGLVVESLSPEKKNPPEKVAEFGYAVRPQDKPGQIDLTWRPPGFDGMCENQQGQKVLGILRGEEKLEVALDFSGTKRPAAFQAGRDCYRLVFVRAK